MLPQASEGQSCLHHLARNYGGSITWATVFGILLDDTDRGKLGPIYRLALSPFEKTMRFSLSVAPTRVVKERYMSDDRAMGRYRVFF